MEDQDFEKLSLKDKLGHKVSLISLIVMESEAIRI
jgi:hypothetical protein